MKCKSGAFGPIVKFLRKQQECTMPSDPCNEGVLCEYLRDCNNYITQLGAELLRDSQPDPKDMSKLIVQSLVFVIGGTSMALN